MQTRLLLLLVLFFIDYATASDPVPTGRKAHCDLTSTKGNFLGKIEIEEVTIESVMAVSLKAELSQIELLDGPKGFHIHQFGKTSNNCVDAGPHFNPHGFQHGSPLDHTNRHLGDLGNIHVHSKKAKLNILDSRLKLDKMDVNKEGIIGRAIVLHEKEDDLGRGNEKDSKSTGAAGSRIACCIINEA